ncbi:MAG TPA: hypothetical protein VLZ75_08480 [Chitinophagales bacterium]|nr:hypothetical protein [Chitinophagales bacterium]
MKKINSKYILKYLKGLFEYAFMFFFLLLFYVPIVSASTQTSLLTSDSLQFKIDSNDFYGVYKSVIWHGVEVGGIKEIKRKCDSLEMECTFFKPFLKHSPIELNNDSTESIAVGSLLANVPREAFMSEWEYSNWNSLTDYTLGWKISTPDSELWGIRPTITDFFIPRDKDGVALFPSEKILNAYQVNAYIFGKSRILLYVGSEIKTLPKTSDKEYILNISNLIQHNGNLEQYDTLINGYKYSGLRLLGADNYTEFNILGRSYLDKWIYIFYVNWGPEEKHLTLPTIKNIISKLKFNL